jgi:hypothetical protein
MSGGRLHLWTHPSDVLDIALGSDRINFNASERNGVDADLTVRNEGFIWVMGTSFAGADFVDASGGHGTGSKPFRSGLSLWLGPGHNFAHGGAGRHAGRRGRPRPLRRQPPGSLPQLRAQLAVQALVRGCEEALGVLVEVLEALHQLCGDPPIAVDLADAPGVKAGPGVLLAHR